jgi:hypothetical protein
VISSYESSTCNEEFLGVFSIIPVFVIICLHKTYAEIAAFSLRFGGFLFELTIGGASQVA